MRDLHPDRFAEYFNALWRRPPFSWQSALAERVLTRLDSPWPQAIALPTGAGKTACIDIAVYALAASLQRQDSVVRSAAPRRIFFVVDRRIVVDEAYERSRELARRLATAESSVLREVADSLRQIAHGSDDHERWRHEDPLMAFELRGGMYRSEAWARSPLQPIIVSSTVDQLGSRLLFRAYGRGPGMWPVFAGLAANDSLIFLDEAHCAKPFLETLRGIGTYRRLAREPSTAPFHPVVLSATPPPGLDDVFHDRSKERDDPECPLGRRRLAHKPATLIDPVPGKVGRSGSDRFAEALAERALDLARGDLKAVVIFANRVATARAAHANLRSRGHHSILLTGRMRAFDKDDIVSEQLSPLSSRQSESRNLERPTFVVATQTLEVGADLDFDGLVTECASLDALRQRFGRLNRMGRRVEARAAILIRQEQSQQSEDDPVYGAALARTWSWLEDQAGAGREVDFGIAYLDTRLPVGQALESLSARSPSAPILLPAHLDILAQTSPAPRPSPEVSLFLHGPVSAPADVQVCWRVDILGDDVNWEDKARDLVSQCPPASAECLSVPIWRFQQWMKGETTADTSTDVEGERPPEIEPSGDGRRSVIRWSSRRGDGAEVVDDPDKVRPGDVIVIPARHHEEWKPLGDLAESGQTGPVLDWGDRAFRSLRARPLLRLHSELIKQLPDTLVPEALKSELIRYAAEGTTRLEDDPDGVAVELRELLGRLATQLGNTELPRSWHWLREVARSLASDRKLARNALPHPFEGLILRGSRRLSVQGEQADVFTDEDDSSASGTVPVPLAEHLPGVAEFARRFSRASGLPPPLCEAIELAGRLHDLGKADPRFQVLLRNGQCFVAGQLLAKSGSLPKNRGGYARVRLAADYPEGGRHELLSVRLTEHADDVLPNDPVLRDLVLHLIASHHGYCRPFAPVVQDERPVTVSFELLGRHWSYESATRLERLESGVSERYWQLVRRFGWWGLAWLEALLRLADHRRSELEQTLWEEREESNG